MSSLNEDMIIICIRSHQNIYLFPKQFGLSNLGLAWIFLPRLLPTELANLTLAGKHSSGKIPKTAYI